MCGRLVEEATRDEQESVYTGGKMHHHQQQSAVGCDSDSDSVWHPQNSGQNLITLEMSLPRGTPNLISPLG